MSSPSAEPEIRSLVARYALAVTTRDFESWTETWAEECVWELMGQEPKGRDAVLALFKGLMEGIQFVYQMAGQGQVDVDPGGERATGLHPTVEFLRMGGQGVLMLGTYHDVFVKEKGVWRFAERRMKTQYMGPPDMSAAIA